MNFLEWIVDLVFLCFVVWVYFVFEKIIGVVCFDGFVVDEVIF